MNGAYDLEGVIWHQHSPKLMKKIMELWPDKSVPVVDLGCGLNYYARVLYMAGYSTLGVDAKTLGSVIDGSLIENRDLSEPIGSVAVWSQNKNKIGKNFQFVLEWPDNLLVKTNIISLEVGEHIPAEHAGAYLDNVCRFGGDVILSWAIPGQPGHGHINCQSNEWVINEMEKRGYLESEFKSLDMRLATQHCHCTWFRNTLMYFYKKP